jgi:hypothetical protein
MTERLEWVRATDKYWWAVEADGSFRYDARMDKRGAWRLRMLGTPIGPREGFPSFSAARDYVDWGGKPNRMGHDRETGEAHD